MSNEDPPFTPRIATWEDCKVGAEYTHDIGNNKAEWRVTAVHADKNDCAHIGGSTTYSTKSSWDCGGVWLVRPAPPKVDMTMEQCRESKVHATAAIQAAIDKAAAGGGSVDPFANWKPGAVVICIDATENNWWDVGAFYTLDKRWAGDGGWRFVEQREGHESFGVCDSARHCFRIVSAAPVSESPKSTNQVSASEMTVAFSPPPAPPPEPPKWKCAVKGCENPEGVNNEATMCSAHADELIASKQRGISDVGYYYEHKAHIARIKRELYQDSSGIICGFTNTVGGPVKVK